MQKSCKLNVSTLWNHRFHGAESAHRPHGPDGLNWSMTPWTSQLKIPIHKSQVTNIRNAGRLRIIENQMKNQVFEHQVQKTRSKIMIFEHQVQKTM